MDADIVRETSLGFLGPRREGRVRDVYRHEKGLILVATDRHPSFFDRVLVYVPHKGQVINQISAWWCEATKDIIPNHLLAMPDPNVTIAKPCEPLRVGVIVRDFNTGVTATSIWARYCAGQRAFGGIALPDTMKKNTRLPRPVFDPFIKGAQRDVQLSREDLIETQLITPERYDELKTIALALFERGQRIAERGGLMLVDTKYEFGIDTDGNLMLIDELHTPDCSRYWEASSYKKRYVAGEEPEYLDKEFLHLWFAENSDPYNDPELPEVPPELIAELSHRYIHVYERITGKTFVPGEEPIVPRIDRNLKRYFESSTA